MRRSAVGAWVLVAALSLCSAAAPKRSKPRKAPSPAQASTGVQVTGVRFWSTTEATRIAVEVTGDFTVHSDRLSNPDRVFFDLTRVAPSKLPNGIESIPVNDGLVKQVRIAQPVPGTTRVVVDLAVNAEAVTSRLSNPERLMIEVRPAGKPPTVAPATEIATTEKTPVAPVPTPPAAPLADPSAAAVPAERPASSLTRALGLKLGKVVLDAGHGGKDQGTHGPSGLLEKDLVLDVALRLGALIESRLGSEVVYTRDADVYIGLEERTRLANQNKADLFLSIHANSSPVAGVSGIETYFLSLTGTRAALEVAARENASSEKAIHDLQDLVKKIALKDKLEESKDFAEQIQASLNKLSAKSNSASYNRGVKKAPFVVLIGAAMPSVLVEIGFITNSADEALMRKPEYREKIAEALYQGIARYAGGLSHFDVAKRDGESGR